MAHIVIAFASHGRNECAAGRYGCDLLAWSNGIMRPAKIMQQCARIGGNKKSFARLGFQENVNTS